MVPALVAIARDVKSLCPDALFFNYANPMSANCLAIRRATGVPVIGLCHGTFRTERYLAELAGIPESQAKRVTSLGVGVNHFTFILDLRDEGVDLFPDVRQVLGDQERSGRLTHPYSWELFRRWDAYPAPGDRHVVEFVPERFPGGRYYGKTLGVDAFSFENAVAVGDERYAESIRQAAGELPFDASSFPKASSSESEQVARMVDAIHRDSRQVFYVNAPNDGACAQLPPGALLELPAVATGRGFRTTPGRRDSPPASPRSSPDASASSISRSRRPCAAIRSCSSKPSSRTAPSPTPVRPGRWWTSCSSPRTPI